MKPAPAPTLVSEPAPVARVFRRRRLWIRIALLLFLGLFLLANAIAAWQAWRLIHFSDAGPPVTKSRRSSAAYQWSLVMDNAGAPRSRITKKPAFPYVPFRVATADGYSLACWQSTAAPATSTTVVLCHGHGSSRSGVLSEATALHDLGHRVILFDFRAHGESTGNVCSIGYHEAADVKAVWDWVARAYPGDSIALYGISMGAVASARAVSHFRLTPIALILDMPYDRLRDAVHARMKLMGLPTEPTSSLLLFWGGVFLKMPAFNWSTSGFVSNIQCPLLLQWGEKDTRVSRRETLLIQGGRPAPPIALVTYPAAGHSSLCRSQPQTWKTAVSAILQAQPSPLQKSLP